MESEGGVYPARDFSPAKIPYMLISSKQHQANRSNAQHSTGPTTPEGKAAIRFNALTYGLRTRATVIPDENAEEYSHLWDELEAEWQPQTRPKPPVTSHQPPGTASASSPSFRPIHLGFDCAIRVVESACPAFLTDDPRAEGAGAECETERQGGGQRKQHPGHG